MHGADDEDPAHRHPAQLDGPDFKVESERLAASYKEEESKAFAALEAFAEARNFLMLHLRDLLADGLVWEKLRRFLRGGLLQIEEPGTAFAPIPVRSRFP
jgi:hypothetical protein